MLLVDKAGSKREYIKIFLKLLPKKNMLKKVN
jgi:hypothetical protein